jgi:hypothetical protein
MSNADIQLYVNSMARIRERISFIQTVNVNKIEVGSTAFKGELLFLNFRKVLEEIAFSSLAANKDKYTEAWAEFATHWNAKKILRKLDQLNPNFYPVGLNAPVEVAPGQKHFEPIPNGFMDRDEFVELYQISSQVLHTRNPYDLSDPTIQAKYTVADWVTRIQKLLSWHNVELIDQTRWVVHIPPEGNVQAWAAVPSSASGSAI